MNPYILNSPEISSFFQSKKGEKCPKSAPYMYCFCQLDVGKMKPGTRCLCMHQHFWKIFSKIVRIVPVNTWLVQCNQAREQSFSKSLFWAKNCRDMPTCYQNGLYSNFHCILQNSLPSSSPLLLQMSLGSRLGPYMELQPVEVLFQVFLQSFVKPEAYQRHRSCLYVLVSSTFERKWCHFQFHWPPGSLCTKTSSRTINKHVKQYFSISSLIARPVNGLLFSLVVKQMTLAVKYRCL